MKRLSRANFSRPADNTAYTAGDIIANSGTAASVVPLEFPLIQGTKAGILTGCRAVVTPASGNLVVTALDFDLLVFRPESGVPFAAAGYPADNAAMAITAAAYRELVATFRFSAGSWRNPAGAVTAGVTGYQSQMLNSSRPYAPFDLSGLSPKLIGVVQVLGAWTPTGVVNRFDFALDVDMD